MGRLRAAAPTTPATVANMSPTAPSGVQLHIPIAPPGRQTRSISAAVRSWSGANMQPKVESTRSNESGAKGRCSASPSTQSTSTIASAARSRAIASSSGTRSKPGRAGAEARDRDRGVAGAAGDVEHVHPRLHVDPLDQQLRRARDLLGHRGVVAAGPDAAGLVRTRGSSVGELWRVAVLRAQPVCGRLPDHGCDRHCHRRPPALRRGRRCRRRPRRRQRQLRARALQRHHGTVGIGQVHAHAHPRRARPPDRGLRPARRHRDHGPRRRRPDQAAPRQARLHLPVLQPDPGPHGRGERDAAAGDRRRQAGQGVDRPADRHRRPLRPPHPPPVRALRRTAAARRGRARARVASGGRVRRRADRQPRLEGERGGAARCCARPSTSSARPW